MMEEHLYIALGLAGAAGVLIGMIVTGLILLEHPIRYLVCTRVSAALYKNLRLAAERSGWSVATEVHDRLLASFEKEGR